MTTGLCVLTVRPRWLAGEGDATWLGLRKAIVTAWHGQIGREARVWVGGKAAKPGRDGVVQGAERLGAISRRVGSAPIDALLSAELGQLLESAELLDQWPDAAWGYEDFIPRMGGMSREALVPMRLFARLEAAEIVYGENGRAPFIQNAAIAKTTATNPRLLQAGLYRAGMDHATDAARHCATFLRRARQSENLRCQAWPRIFQQVPTTKGQGK